MQEPKYIYRVPVYEKRVEYFEVEARNEDEAIDLAMQRYESSPYGLDSITVDDYWADDEHVEYVDEVEPQYNPDDEVW